LSVFPDKFCPTSFTSSGQSRSAKLAGNSANLHFPLCVLFVFLLLSALYESWSLPLAIILIVPMCCSLIWRLAALMENSIFTQIGFVVLVGRLQSHPVIEFMKQIRIATAKSLHRRGRSACD
jgi:multidrug efflux pump subunit AcrB